ncbi:uncharacterized protein MONBRDRAFT_35584 [Monosiga brevicollis MX1]|uniref:Uncharacterized protein n=1 Tax=Monosiga brevicollis TaxID=81824 RepID=A9UQ26_MONBE|nr:uncharacterized protein MONBRDRAFT_35584 [Monosiga brevicollis MX1]EDQ92523.1 predicted protein [Monosiga brevicollis MX1]|eukprot:XP_001742285.1 hypothetical protein [Monosiga brevicollis MX1]
MNVYHLARSVLDELCAATDGLNVMLVDEDTLPLVSMVYGWRTRQLSDKEVFSVDKLASLREPMPEVNATVFVRASHGNILSLQQELSQPNYRSYAIFFTNEVDATDLELLAEADTRELVAQIKVVNLDYLPMDTNLFSLETLGAFNHPEQLTRNMLSRCRDGLLSVIRGLGLHPTLRYQGNSGQCQQLAEALKPHLLQATEGDTMLLLLDRRQDLVTPSIQQWTYQAMMHELYGLSCGRLDLTRAQAELKEVEEPAVMTSFADEFFGRARFTKFPQNYLSIMELEKVVTKRFFRTPESNYFDFQSHAQERFEKIQTALRERRYEPRDLLRIFMQVAIRYPDKAGCAEYVRLQEAFLNAGLSPLDLQCVDRAAELSRPSAPASSKDWESYILRSTFPNADPDDEEEDSHTPLLAGLLQELDKGSLNEKKYPWVPGLLGQKRYAQILFSRRPLAHLMARFAHLDHAV